jgi:ABC-type multidrug transport system fused ATPase/permease subunit
MFTAAKSFSHFFWKILYYRWPHKLLVVFLSLLSTVFGLLGPLLQKDFVDRITGENLILSRVLPHLTNWDTWTSLHFLIASFVAVALYLLCSAGATLISQNEALYLQRKLAQEMYEKNLRLRNDQLKNHTVGEVVSYYATDVPGSTILIEQSLPQGAGIFFPLGLTPILLVTLFGVPATILLVSFVAVLGFSLYLGLRQSRFFFFFKNFSLFICIELK